MEKQITELKAENNELKEKLKLNYVPNQLWQQVHVLSHQKLLLTFYELEKRNKIMKGNFIKCNKKNIDIYAFPKPILHFFKHINWI